MPCCTQRRAFSSNGGFYEWSLVGVMLLELSPPLSDANSSDLLGELEQMCV